VSLSPAIAYRRLNKLLWRNRLPKAKIVHVDDTVMPNNHGFTVDDDGDADFRPPLLFLNTSNKRRGKTLLHEMLHIAEPQLPHCKAFYAIVESYWKFANKHIKGLDKL
jgi:hypothetical protein